MPKCSRCHEDISEGWDGCEDFDCPAEQDYEDWCHDQAAAHYASYRAEKAYQEALEMVRNDPEVIKDEFHGRKP